MQDDDREIQIFLLEDSQSYRTNTWQINSWEAMGNVLLCARQHGTHIPCVHKWNSQWARGLRLKYSLCRGKMEAVGSFRGVINVDCFELFKRTWPIERSNNWWGNPEWAENISETGTGSSPENGVSRGKATEAGLGPSMGAVWGFSGRRTWNIIGSRTGSISGSDTGSGLLQMVRQTVPRCSGTIYKPGSYISD